ncbi:hemagglutinin repeat-containing protein [Microvirgula aerodenitrificans]|uniref:hemagglutinin repeat-containing protein n=1 Tax=Microvirgula aerodenitrificans TaxID=57480 RepID=UPI002F3FBEA2
MNKNCYRIVFNPARDCLMAVQENARGKGKDVARSTGPGGVPAPAMHVAAFRAIAIFTLMSLGAAAYAADIVAAPGGGQKPVVGQAPSGLTVVQIAAPSAAGVSHNQYQQFNVPKAGVILNNSQKVTSTQLAGYIEGNANLAGGTARVILNEVIAANPSRLNGFLEVAGQKAEVIIANPWGISCSGCGFINTSRATLTTGTPILSNGALTGYLVRDGLVELGGDPVDVSNLDSFTIISRALQVNTDLHARDLTAILGANRVDRNSLAATPIAADTPAPRLALDVASLGGMYAGVIKLVGTEAGVGVNSQGRIQATQGNLQLSSAGDLTLSGQTSASGTLSLRADGSLQHDGTTASGGALSLDAGKQAQLDGTLVAGGDLVAQADSVSGKGMLAAGSTADGTLSAPGALILTTSDALHYQGQILASDTLTLRGASLDLSGVSASSAHGDIHLDSGRALVTDQASITAAGQLKLEAGGQFSNRDGALSASGFDVHADSIDNRHGRLVATAPASASRVTVSGDVDNRDGGVLGSAGELTLTSQSLNNRDGLLSAVGFDLNTDMLDNRHGQIEQLGSGTSSLVAGQLDNREQGSLLGNGALSLNVASLDNSQGLLQAGTELTIDGHTLSNRLGRILALGNGQSRITMQDVLHNAGSISTNGDLLLKTASFDNQGGTVASQRDLSVNAHELPQLGKLSAGRGLALDIGSDFSTAVGDTLQANHDLSIRSDGKIGNAGALLAVNDLTLQGTTLENSGEIRANGTLSATLSQSLDNAASGSVFGRQLGLNAPTINNRGLIAGQHLSLNGTDLLNDGEQAVIAAAGDLSLQFGNSLINRNKALINAEGKLNIGSAQYATRQLSNLQSTIQAGGDAVIYADTIENASNPVTVTQSTTTSSKTQDTIRVGQGCNGGSSSYNGRGIQTYSCNSNFNYVLSLNFDSNAIVENMKYVGTAGSAHTMVTPAIKDFYIRYRLVEDDINNKIIKVEVKKLIPANNWDGRGGAPGNAVWNNVASSIQEIAYFDKIGNSYVFVPDFNPNTNLLSPDMPRDIYTAGIGQISFQKAITEYNSKSIEQLSYIDAGYLNNYSIKNLAVTGRDSIAAVGEARRVTTTTVSTDITSGDINFAKILVAGNLLVNSRQITNQYSTIAVGEDLSVHSTQPIKNIGQSLNKTTVYDIASTIRIPGASFSDIMNGRGSYVSKTTRTEVEQIGSVDAVVSSGKALTLTAPAINNTTINAADVAKASGSGPDSASTGKVLVGNPVTGQYQLPSGGLFRTVTAPGQHYLVQSDPRFTQYAKFISSDYMLSRLGYDPNVLQKRLGDGYYEQQLVSQAITGLTGKKSLGSGVSAMDEYQNLMNNGVQYAQQFKLTPGIALSSGQMAALTSDMVWLVSQNIGGQDVLVPVVYLANGQAQSVRNQGAVLAGTSMTLTADGTLSNSGLLQTQGGKLIANAENIDIQSGLVRSDDTIELKARQDLVLASDPAQLGRTGSVDGKNVRMEAGKDLTVRAARVNAQQEVILSAGHNLDLTSSQTLRAAQTENRAKRGRPATWSRTGTVTEGSSVTSGSGMQLLAGNDLAITASQVSVGGGLSAAAANNLTVQSTVDTERETVAGGKAGFDNRTDKVNFASVKGLGDISLVAGQNLALTAAQLQSGQSIALGAGQDIQVGTVTTTRTSTSYKRDYDHNESDINQAGSVLVAAKDLNVAANRDIRTRNAYLTADKGQLALVAGRDVELGTAQSTHSDYTRTVKKRSGFMSKKTTTTIIRNESSTERGTSLSGNTTVVQAGNDLGVKGGSVVSTQETTLLAGRNLTLDAASDSSFSSYFKKTKKSGMFSSGGFGVTIGSMMQSDQVGDRNLTYTGSTAGSVLGNVTLRAGQDLKLAGSDLIAGGDLTAIGQNVTFDSAMQRAQHDEKHERKQSGLTVALSGGVVMAAQAAMEAAKAAKESDSGRLAALQGVKAGLSGYQAWQQFAAAGGPTGDPSFVGISLSIGNQKSQSQSQSVQTNALSSELNAGGDVLVKATGNGRNGADGRAETGDLTVRGSSIKGSDVTLSAARDLILESAMNSTDLSGSNKSSGWSAGISFGVANGKMGFTIFANGNKSKGKENGDTDRYTETNIAAADTLVLQSGRDTTLTGALASGDTLLTDVGRNLTLTSQQDHDHYDSKQTSIAAGASFTWGSMSGSGYVNFSKQKINSDFDSVIDQTGLYAGKGGYDVHVGEHTQLNGAVIASTANPDRNRLDTGTLGWSNLNNKAEFKVESQSVGFSGSGSGGGGSGSGGGSMVDSVKMSTAASAATALAGGSRSGSAESTSYAAISDGTLNIRNPDQQQQDTATLSHDVEHAANGLSPIFNKEKELNRLKEVQLIGEIGQQAVQIVVTEKMAAAERDLKDKLQTNPEYAKSDEYKKLKADLDNEWGIGSDFQKAATAVTAALQGLAGGNIGAAISGAAAPYLATVIKNMTTDPVTGEVNKGANALAHAVLGAVLAQAKGQDAMAGAIGAGSAPLVADYLVKEVYGKSSSGELDENQKATISALTTLAGALGGGLAGGDLGGAVVGGETARNEVENNSLTVEQLEALRVEARSCERLNNCEAVQKKYRSLSLEQQDKIAALCSTDPIKCKAAYGGYVTDYMAFRSAVDRVMKDDIPYALKLDVATYVLQNLDARGMVADAVFAKQMAEKLGISEENARLISLAAWGVIGKTKKYDPKNASGEIVLGKNNAIPYPEITAASNGLGYKSNPKHTPGQIGFGRHAGTEPKNSLDLFASSVQGGEKRYAKDEFGNVHQFSDSKDGSWHWSGSSGDKYVRLNINDIPIYVKRKLDLPRKGK